MINNSRHVFRVIRLKNSNSFVCAYEIFIGYWLSTFRHFYQFMEYPVFETYNFTPTNIIEGGYHLFQILHRRPSGNLQEMFYPEDCATQRPYGFCISFRFARQLRRIQYGRIHEAVHSRSVYEKIPVAKNSMAVVFSDTNLKQM